MRGRLAEWILSAIGICILLGAIAVFGDRDRLIEPGTYGRQPVAGLATSGVNLQRMTMELPTAVKAYAGGNPVMVMYGLASLSLILLMLRE